MFGHQSQCGGSDGECHAGGYGYGQGGLFRWYGGVVGYAGRGDDYGDDLYVERWRYVQYDDRQQQDVTGIDGGYDLHGAVA
jgi:hypothetical protein